jgi:hypothetical protein
LIAVSFASEPFLRRVRKERRVCVRAGFELIADGGDHCRMAVAHG